MRQKLSVEYWRINSRNYNDEIPLSMGVNKEDLSISYTGIDIAIPRP
jgi:hypothetical protein